MKYYFYFKKPEPKRFCRDPDVLKDESSKVGLCYLMKY